MDLDRVIEHCRTKKGETEDFPFDMETLCIRAGGKIFLLTDINSNPLRINLKCDPDLARDLRQRYPSVIPGYHMNKDHWNTVILDGKVPDEDILRMIDMSHDLVVKGLPKKVREELISDLRG